MGDQKMTMKAISQAVRDGLGRLNAGRKANPLLALVALAAVAGGGYVGYKALTGGEASAQQAAAKGDDWGVSVPKPQAATGYTKIGAPLEALGHMGKPVQLTFVVAGGYKPASGKVALLNSEGDYKSPTNINVVWFPAKTPGITYDPRGLKGRTVSVRGTVGQYQGRTQIVVDSPENIRVH